jgi:hypothetical protein
MTDEEIINDVLEDDNSENEQESSTPLITRIIRHDAISVFNVCYKWVEENTVQAEDILTLKRLQEKVLIEAFRNKHRKLLSFFFVKTQ